MHTHTLYLFNFLRFYLFMRHRERKRERERERQRHRRREKQAPSREPADVGLDPRTRGHNLGQRLTLTRRAPRGPHPIIFKQPPCVLPCMCSVVSGFRCQWVVASSGSGQGPPGRDTAVLRGLTLLVVRWG